MNKETGLPEVDSSKPSTKIQIRFHNGDRQAVEFNVDNTVADIHMYVMQAAPVDGSYELISGFPPKPLDSPDLTIAAAGLKGASVIQKIL